MDISEIYNTMNHLNLIDKDDIILYLSSQMDIIEKISHRRRDLQSKYYLYDDKVRTIHNFLKYVLLRNRVRDIIATTRLDKEYYTNTETLLGVSIDEIQENLFFSYTDKGFRYAFDIREIGKLIDYNMNNPYNTQEIPYLVIKQVKRLMRTQNFGDILAYIQMSIPLNSSESAKIASVFNTLCNLYVYPDIRKFLKFTGRQYLYFIQDLRTNVLINKYIPSYLYDLILENYDKNVEKTRRFVLDSLLKILNVKDNNRYTRALVISEQITNTTISNDSSDNDSDDTDNDDNSEENSSIRIQTNPLFRRRGLTTALTTRRRRRLLRLNNTRNLFSIPPPLPETTTPLLRPTIRPPPTPPVRAPPPPPLPPGLLTLPLEPVAVREVEAELFTNIVTQTENVLNELESNPTINNEINTESLSELTNSIQNQINNILSRLDTSNNINNDDTDSDHL